LLIRGDAVPSGMADAKDVDRAPSTVKKEAIREQSPVHDCAFDHGFLLLNHNLRIIVQGP
jgi:hypothetical protein